MRDVTNVVIMDTLLTIVETETQGKKDIDTAPEVVVEVKNIRKGLIQSILKNKFRDRHRNRSRSSNSSYRKKNHRKKTVSSQSRSNSDKSLSNRIKDDKSPKKESKSKEITFKEENNVTTINPNNLNLKENILVDTPEESKWIYIDYFRSIEISKDDKIDNNLNCIDEISKNEIGEIVQINNDNKNDKVNLKENIIENNNGDNSI